MCIRDRLQLIGRDLEIVPYGDELGEGPIRTLAEAERDEAAGDERRGSRVRLSRSEEDDR